MKNEACGWLSIGEVGKKHVCTELRERGLFTQKREGEGARPHMASAVNTQVWKLSQPRDKFYGQQFLGD